MVLADGAMEASGLVIDRVPTKRKVLSLCMAWRKKKQKLVAPQPY
jgi:hypothetical protein